MDMNEHRPMIHDWLKTFDSFNFVESGDWMTLQCDSISLAFKKEGDSYKYDGWSKHFDEPMKLDEQGGL